jgi:hypothetical protein
LNPEIINTLFCLLAALFLFTIRFVGSASRASGSPTHDGHDASTFFHPELITLVPVCFPPSDYCDEHWLLCVVDSTGTRVWDLMRNENTRQAVSEILPSHQNHDLGTIKEMDCPQAESVDTGISVVVNTVCIVSATLGAEMWLPEIREGFLWRDVLKSMLGIRSGGSFRLCWGIEFEDDTVLLEGRDSNGNEVRKALCSNTALSISYQAASSAIQHQRLRLDKAAAVKRERRERIIASGTCIRGILGFLATLASIQKH